jgi:glycosyltransferase involved in cell wall biosynthesis
MKNRTKLLIFDPSSWLQGAGGTSYLRNIGDGLSAFRGNYEIIFFCNVAARPIIGNFLEPHYEVLYTEKETTGFAAAKARSKQLNVLVANLRPQVVITMNQCDADLNVPVLTFFRNRLYFERRALWFKSVTGLKQKFKYYLLHRRALKSIQRSDFLLFPTLDFGNLVKQQVLHSKPWAAVPFGLNTETVSDIRERRSRGEISILSMHYNIHKNYRILWLALKNIWQRGHDHLKWIVLDDLEHSNYPCGRKLFEEIAATPFLSSIRFLGRIPQSQMKKAYASADIFVYPTLCESFGHGLVEALGNGMPCIASDIGVNRELANNSIIYADPHDANDWVEKIELLVSDETLLDRLGRSAKERGQHFSWNTHSQQLIGCVNKVLKIE